MKMRVVISIFFRSHRSGNCVLHYIILFSDEFLVFVPADDSRKVFISLTCTSLQAPAPGR